MHFGEIKQPEILIYPQWRTLDFKRGQRKNALASKGKLCRPETMPTGNQYARHELSVWNKQQKSHLVSQNVFLQNIIYPWEKKKKLLEQAAFWHEVKVVCCLPTPFFTLWTRLPRSTCFKGGFHSHVSAESSQNWKGLGWNGNMEHSENHSGKRQIKHTLMQGRW